MTLVFLAALLPGLFLEQGPETLAALKDAGIERVYGPAALALAPDAVKVPAPGVRYRPDVATASSTTWVDANGWRFARNRGKIHFKIGRASCRERV